MISETQFLCVRIRDKPDSFHENNNSVYINIHSCLSEHPLVGEWKNPTLAEPLVWKSEPETQCSEKPSPRLKDDKSQDF